MSYSYSRAVGLYSCSDLSQYVRTVRHNLRLGLEGLSDLADVDKAALSRIECGVTRSPKLKVIEKMLTALGSHPRYLAAAGNGAGACSFVALPARLRLLRADYCLAQSELARIVGVDRSVVRHAETTGGVRLDGLLAIASALGIVPVVVERL